MWTTVDIYRVGTDCAAIVGTGKFEYRDEAMCALCSILKSALSTFEVSTQMKSLTYC